MGKKHVKLHCVFIHTRKQHIICLDNYHFRKKKNKILAGKPANIKRKEYRIAVQNL